MDHVEKWNKFLHVNLKASFKCNLHLIEDLYIEDKFSRIPQHIQRTNASLALAVSKAFMKLKPKNVNNNIITPEFDLDLAKKSIEEARWPGRYEIIRRNNSVFYLDGAHTVDSMQVCADWFLSKTHHDNRQKVLLFNVTGDRNPENLLKLLLKCQFSTVIFLPNVGDDDDNPDSNDQIQPVRRQLEKCHRHAEIWKNMDENSNPQVFPSIASSLRFLERLDSQQRDVLVTGSIHLIGAAMSVLDPTLGGLL